MKFVELESERLIYRKFKQEDFPIFFDWLSNPENRKYQMGEAKSELETRNDLNWIISTSEKEECDYFEFAIVLKSNRSLIGSGCTINILDNPEVGWTVHRNYWRQGYGTEIGKTMLKFGFETLNLRRIIAGCNAKNQGSYKIMEKIGMRREAHFIKAQQGNGALNYEWCDRFQYAMLKEEWTVANE